MDFTLSKIEQSHNSATSLKSQYTGQIHKGRYGGKASAKPHTVGKVEQSRNYGGSKNISDFLKNSANELQKQLNTIEAETYELQRHRVAQGYGHKIPRKVQDKINALRLEISRINRDAREIAGVSHTPHKVAITQNFKLVKVQQ